MRRLLKRIKPKNEFLSTIFEWINHSPIEMFKFISIISLLLVAGYLYAERWSQNEFAKLKPRSIEELKLDMLVYEEYCGNCHEIKKPNSKTEEEWKLIVPRMVAKSKKTEDMAIDAVSQARIMQYLLTMSQTTAKR